MLKRVVLLLLCLMTCSDIAVSDPWPGADTTPSGIISMFAGTTPPRGWLACDGSAISIATYPRLYSAIGTTWNTATNPTTGSAYSSPSAGTFRLPDLRGVYTRGVGTAANTVATTLAGYAADTTKKNGLSLADGKTVSGGVLSGTLTLNGAGVYNYATSNHTHNIAHVHQWGYTDTIQGGLYSLGTAANYALSSFTTSGAQVLNKFGVASGGAANLNYTQVNAGSFHTSGVSGNQNSNVGTNAQSGTESSSGTINISLTNGLSVSTVTLGGAVTLLAGDTETRPVTQGVNYIIKAL